MADVRDVSETRERRAGHCNVVLLRVTEARPGHGDELLDRERPRQQALLHGDGDGNFQVAAVRLEPEGSRRRVNRGAGGLPAFAEEAEQLAHRLLVVRE